MASRQLTTVPLNGRTALVSGGSRGIGAAIVRRLAREGAKVSFTYVSSAVLAKEIIVEIEAAGGRALAVRADNRDESAVRNAVDRVVDEFGGVDILVNNAGVATVARSRNSHPRSSTGCSV